MSSSESSWREHPNARVLRDFFEAFGKGDAVRLAELVKPDLVWHFPGTSPIAGDWQGVEGILEGIRSIAMTIGDGKNGFELLEVTASEHCAITIHRDYYTGTDNHFNMRYAIYVRMEDGKMAEAWEIPFDLNENERYFGTGVKLILKKKAEANQ